MSRQRAQSRRINDIRTYGTAFPKQEMKKDRFWKARQLGYRSGLEVHVGNQLAAAGLPVRPDGVPECYESTKIYYTPPLKLRSYTPDYYFPNGVVVETKGRFTTEDRQKHKNIKAEHPDLDLRFVFSDANQRLSKNSPTTYAAWATQYGFQYATGSIPASWIEEPRCERRIKALEAAGVKPSKTK